MQPVVVVVVVVVVAEKLVKSTIRNLDRITVLNHNRLRRVGRDGHYLYSS